MVDIRHILRKKNPNCHVLEYFSVGSQEHGNIYIYIYSQIWLYSLLDGCHFVYITKLIERKNISWVWNTVGLVILPI